MPSLAQELIEAIIDQADDETTLKSFSITAHRFVVPSQRLIFRSVIIGPAPGLYGALQTRLIASPHLALYIHELQVNLVGSHGAAVAYILRSIPNLRRLDFRSSDLSWNATTHDVHGVIDALVTLIAQPSLCYLAIIDAWQIPPSFILYAVSSVSFFLILRFDLGVDKASPIAIPEFPHDFRASLTHLVAEKEYPSGGPRLVDVLLRRPAALASLEFMGLEILKPQPLLLAVSPTLQYLRIADDSGSDLPDDSPQNLPALSPHLRKLELTVVLFDGIAMPAHLASVFAKIAEDLPSMEVIVLHCHIAQHAPPQHTLPPSVPFLPSELHFPRLREVQCVLRDHHKWKRLRTALEETIPALRGLTTWLAHADTLTVRQTAPFKS
ncbi:hypothetical protein C8J57DRAFT_610382 [Mycena rebaudengoi]|nr:hypothetical protein C8J57DRAFT_610382 [Mycena rebaudengoi]